jgi:hypothetical protein
MWTTALHSGLVDIVSMSTRMLQCYRASADPELAKITNVMAVPIADPRSDMKCFSSSNLFTTTLRPFLSGTFRLYHY